MKNFYKLILFCLLLTAAMAFTALTASAATVSGRVLFDRNRTANSAGAGISGIANVPVVLQEINTNVMLAVLTDVNGNYAFYNVPDGTYRIVQTFGIPAIATPGNFINAAVSPIPNSQTPPISDVPSPPAGATHIDFVTPGTLLITVAFSDVPNQHFLNGPVKYTPYADDRIDWTTNLITAANDGTFGFFLPASPANTGVPTEPYPGVVPDFTYVLPNPAISTPNDGEYSVQNIMNNNNNNTLGSWW